MSIQNYLNQIKNAVFGKDVRQSIYDAIKQCYEDASINHDNANMEVKLARGSHDTLNERFTSVEENIKTTNEQLDNKTNKGDISVSDINKNKGLLDETYFTDEFKAQFIENTQPINATPKDYSITQQKMVIPYVEAKQSKNLFDKNTVTLNKYVDYLTGNLLDSELHCVSDYIPIIPNSEYRISGDNEQIAFYNETKEYVTGFVNSQITVTPNNAYFIRITLYKTKINELQLEKGSEITPYVPYYLTLDTDKIVEPIPLDKLSGKVAVLNVGKNLFNKDTVKDGCYINYTTGGEITLLNYSASEFIEVEENMKYTISGTIEQLACYDEFKKYIKGWKNANEFNNDITPSNCKYIRLTVRNTELDKVQFEKGNLTSYESYGKYLDFNYIGKTNLEKIKNYIEGVNNIITVGVGKEYVNLRTALESITDSSENNTYTVLIHEGEYDIMSYYTDDEINNSSFIGLIKPPYVDLVGVGDNEKIILKGELTSNFPSTTRTRVSTLATKGTGKLENLTVSAKHLRYAVHDDYNYTGLVRECINCVFIKYSSSGHPQAYGSGVWSGHKHIFEDCIFISEEGIAYSVHNNKGFTVKASVELISCKFNSSVGENALRFGSMGSGTKDTIKLIGCESNKKALFFEEQSNGVGCDFEVKGYGNDIFDITVTGTTSKTITNTNGFIKTV